jgi:hypothetical protein
MSSAAESLFSEFVTGGVARIDQAVAEGEFESGFLDFKETVTKDGRITKEDRKNLGKNLSAFANASGGLLVWGISEVSTGQEEPRMKALATAPIANVRRFVRDLNTEVGQLVAPLVRGVMNEAIELPGGSGYALTLVPESRHKPHMSMASEDKRYWFRSGSQSRVMEHQFVQALMRVGQAPELELFIDFHELRESLRAGTPVRSVGNEYRVTLSLLNTGNAVAREVVVTLPSKPGRTYSGHLDLSSQSIVHVVNDTSKRDHALQFRMNPSCIFYPRMVVHNIEMIQLIQGNIPEETTIPWRIDAQEFSASGELVLDLKTIKMPPGVR